MINRSARREVRNPVLGMPAAKRVDEMPPAARAWLRQLLLEMQADARQRAEECWRRHKAPMALYWKAVGVYVGHIARVLNG